MAARTIVRRPSSRLAEGQVTHIDRVPMDVERAFEQYAEYLAVLRRHGCDLIEAPPADDYPDGVFVEDALVMVEGLAVLTRPGASSRRGEVDSMAALIADLGLPSTRIAAPATVDGGDVLCVGRHVFIGLTTRTNAAGIEAFAAAVAPLGRTVIGVDVPGCLHLKSAITALPDESLIAVEHWVDPEVFRTAGYRVHITTDTSGGDVLCLGETVVLPADAPAAAELVAGLGFTPLPVDVSELQKIEAGVTCMSVLIDPL